MITPMSLDKAEAVAARGPKTEAQRCQAIKTLRRFANQMTELGYQEVVKDARKMASKLSQLGDLNRKHGG